MVLPKLPRLCSSLSAVWMPRPVRYFYMQHLLPEIAEALSTTPGQHPSDRPDIVDRVFQVKLNLLVDDITKHSFFGPILGGITTTFAYSFGSCLYSLHHVHSLFAISFFAAVVYTIEFQKRGLPHVHIIIWLQPDGPRTADKIDSYISAQLPDPLLDRVGYDPQKIIR